MKYIKLFEHFEQIEKYEIKDGKLDLNDENKFCKLIDGPFLDKNPLWKNVPLIADDFFSSLLRIENVITGDKARCRLNEVVPITKKEWELKRYFKGSSSTGLESENIRFIYNHFKKGGSIDSLEDSLKKLYKESPGIFNFSNFSEKDFIDIIDKVAEGDESLEILRNII